MKPANDMRIRRGDIFFADLGDTVGSEQNGIRPVLVVQNDLGNAHSPTLIVAPFTTKVKKMTQPTHVEIGERFGLQGNSIALLEQIRTIDRSRLLEYIGRADKTALEEINAALRISLDLD